MCLTHEHRYRIEITIGHNEAKFDLVVNAHHLTEAISKAEGYVFEKYPGKMVNFSTYHLGYESREVAEEHGAKFADVDPLSFEGLRARTLPVTLSLLEEGEGSNR